jgi:hypothetical protein
VSGALFDPDEIVRAVRAAANLAPLCDNRDFATSPADCRNVATVARRDALADGGNCRNVAIVATPLDHLDADDEPAIEERAGLAADRVPAVYLDAWARLQCQRPHSVADAEWRLAINDAGLFLDAWGADAAAMQWSAGELFDLPRAGRPGGLVWQLNGKGIDALGPDHVRTNDGRVILRGARERRPNSSIRTDDRGGTHETG